MQEVLATQVGKAANNAKDDLTVLYPDMEIGIYCVGDMVIQDWRLDRLRIWCDPTDMKVVEVIQG